MYERENCRVYPTLIVGEANVLEANFEKTLLIKLAKFRVSEAHGDLLHLN